MYHIPILLWNSFIYLVASMLIHTNPTSFALYYQFALSVRFFHVYKYNTVRRPNKLAIV